MSLSNMPSSRPELNCEGYRAGLGIGFSSFTYLTGGRTGSCGILGFSFCVAGLFLSCIMIPLKEAAASIFQRDPNRWPFG